MVILLLASFAAAGGPIVHPSVQLNLFRSSGQFTLLDTNAHIRLHADVAGYRLEGDGQVLLESLHPNVEEVLVTTAAHSLPLVVTEPPAEANGFLDNLHRVLNWNRPHVSRHLV